MCSPKNLLLVFLFCILTSLYSPQDYKGQVLTVKGHHVGFKFKFNLGKSIKSSRESEGGQAGGGPIDCGIGTEGV